MTTAQQQTTDIQSYLEQLSTDDMPDKIQEILPVLSKLDDEEYDYLHNLLMAFRNHYTSSNDTSNRWGQGYLGKVTISDDFTDELSDDFWLGNE